MDLVRGMNALCRLEMFNLTMFMSSFNSLGFLFHLKMCFGFYNYNMIRILSMASSESRINEVLTVKRFYTLQQCLSFD